MALAIPRPLVEFILLGPEDDRRQLQDSPILGDVWLEFARNPAAALELLITPFREHAAGSVASALSEYSLLPKGGLADPDIAYLQGIIAARLSFEEVLRFVVPMTSWWGDRRISQAVGEYAGDRTRMEADIQHLLGAARNWQSKTHHVSMRDVETRKRYIALAGLILWAARQTPPKGKTPADADEQIGRILRTRNLERAIADGLVSVFGRLQTPVTANLVWTISLNRPATPAISKSVPAVKADAAPK